ncbi:MAG: AEC family transporter [Verrucomicrobiae bacterium]|nr:AEC family transporter [Verrucomicrobiae bacterium]NNJ42799.1 AEC family transporter [Akkermansiaceae bacterium]
MHESWLVLQAALPVYIIVALGTLLRRTGALTPEMDKGVMSTAVHLFFPCLILDKMLGAEILRDASVVLSSAGIGFGLILAGTAVAYVVAPLIGLKIGSGRRTFAVSGGLQNYGFIAIPLVAYLYHDDEVMAVLFTHNLGVETAMWTIGLMLLSGVAKPSARVFLKGPIIAVIVGLVLIQTGTDHLIPGVARSVFSMLGVCAVPVSLLLVGTTLYDLAGKVKFDWKIGLGGVVVRLALVPVLFLLLAKYLPLAVELKKVLVVQSALPSAMFPIVLSRHYGGRTDVAIQLVIATTIASLLTMPLVIGFGKYWVGL